MKADFLIKNVNIYDGSGAAPFFGSVLISGGKIIRVLKSEASFPGKAASTTKGSQNPGVAVIGKTADVQETDTAVETIDGQGLDLAPGFIDSHSHADEFFETDSERLHALQMGVTTEIAGQCGHTSSPYPADVDEKLFRMASGSWVGKHYESFGQMLRDYEERRLPLGPNQAWFTGHGALRTSVMGFENRRASQAEIAEMRTLLDKEMQGGALGFSTGLAYVPGIYSDAEEISGIAEALKPYGGIYTSHSRSESSGLFDAVGECIEVARRAKVPVNISHFKTCYPEFWDRQDKALSMIDDANAEGLTVTLDAYPYIAVSTTTLSAMPAQFLDQGAEAFAEMLGREEIRQAVWKEIYEIDSPTWDNALKHAGADRFLIVGAQETPWIEGLTYTQLAGKLGMADPFDAVVWALRKNHGQITDVRFIMTEENVEKVLSHPLCTVGSDGIYCKGRDRSCHPRAFGTFPRYLGHYVRDRRILSRQEGIRRITGLPAQRYGLKTKGLIRQGFDADLVLFDFDRIIDGGDFKNPFLPNIGIEQVFVAGKCAMKHNQGTGVFAGKFLVKGDRHLDRTEQTP